MQFTLLAAVVLALAQVQVSASPIDISRSATYMTYATYYVDPWVVMQGERAASTASTAAVSAATSGTDAAQSAATTASSSTVTSVLSSSTVTSVVSSSTATELSASSTATASAESELSSASKVAEDAVDFATDEYAYPNAMYTARSMTRGQPAPTSTEEEQYYYAQTQSA